MKQILRISLLLFLLNSCGSSNSISTNDQVTTNFESDFNILFGSCNKQDANQPLWDAILGNKPDVFVWGGDNIYADTEDMDQMQNDYKLQLAQPNYTKLRVATPIIGTWDDHDYGLNDGGTDWEFKDESQQLFLDFIGVSQLDERRIRKGIYHSEVYKTEEGSIKIIVLDTRYFRTALVDNPNPDMRYISNSEGTILGKTQWEWLEMELNNSNADFNFIVSSIQVLSHEHGFETWGNFPDETQKLIDLFTNVTAKNIVILSGDRHISEFSEKNINSLSYPLIDFTSSGLTHAYTDFSGESNKYRVGEVINTLSFGKIEIDFNKKILRMQMRGVGDTVQQEYLVNFNE